MRKYVLIALSLILIAIGCAEKKNDTLPFRFNQLGYYPNAVKKAVLVDFKENDFELVDTAGKVVFSGKLEQEKKWEKSGEYVKVADFSIFSDLGIYRIKVGDKLSYPFKITNELYNDAFKAALKSFYYLRASTSISEKHGGKYHRNAGHLDTLCHFHPSAERGEGTIASTKGWYDAGDCNKYVVNGGVTVGTLLNFYENFPSLVNDGFSNIPESGNNKSDLLDEIKYELDWMKTMQAPDGAAHFKLTSKGFTAFIMPEEDKTERFVVGKATASTLNFAAVMAQSARLFNSYDSIFASDCLDKAEKAWTWATKNPNTVYTNPKDVLTGGYPDSVFVEEFWWSAAELWLSSKNQKYANFLISNEPYAKMEVGESWRKFLGNLGTFSLLIGDSVISNQKKLKELVLKVSDELLVKQYEIPYRIAIDEFQWGSNSDVLNSAILFAYAYEVSNNQKYLDAVVETTDYIFGKNATGYSFLTGFGTNYTRNLHNRTIAADGIEEPIPGFLAGGPNNNREDDIKKSDFGVAYPETVPAKSYVDVQASYASNENAINWNAPLVFVLGFLEAHSDKL